MACLPRQCQFYALSAKVLGRLGVAIVKLKNPFWPAQSSQLEITPHRLSTLALSPAPADRKIPHLLTHCIVAMSIVKIGTL